MATRTRLQRRPGAVGSTTRYEQAWTACALLAGATWMAVAFLQTPAAWLLPLMLLNAVWGGILFVRAPASTRRARHEYLLGALAVAGLVAVVVGVAHHVVVGMLTLAFLAGSAPSLVRGRSRPPKRQRSPSSWTRESGRRARTG